MKQGWIYKKIKDVGEVIGGTTPSTSNPAFWDGDLCWISPAELHGEHYLYDSVKKITKEAAASKSLKQLPAGTVILSSRAPIGKIAINKVPMYCNQGFKCVVCGPELYNEYLYWWFYGNKDYLNSLGTGATFPELSKTVVENIVIPIPPLSEQHRIVERLDSAFAHIDELKANAEKALNEAKALFQKALEKAMEPKEGWEERTLKEITSKIGSGATPKGGKKVYINEGVSLVRSMNVHYDEFKYKDLAHINDNAADQLIGVELNSDDVLFNITGASIARCCVLPEDVLPARVNQHVSILRPIKEMLLPKFLCLGLISFKHQKQLLEIGVSGSTRQAVTKSDLERHIFPIPPLKDQQLIVERLDSLSVNIRKLEDIQRKTIAECDALKQALLRKVFE